MQMFGHKAFALAKKHDMIHTMYTSVIFPLSN